MQQHHVAEFVVAQAECSIGRLAIRIGCCDVGFGLGRLHVGDVWIGLTDIRSRSGAFNNVSAFNNASNAPVAG